MKQTVDYKYLNFIALTNFDLWDVKRYTSRGISSVFPIVDLGSCIQEENKKYKLSEQPEKEFGILGVNNKEGIFDAYHQKGKDIKQAYKKMKVGWIAYNPYRINVGSIGIRLEEHKNEYISPAYVVFSSLENLSPEFLFLLFKTERFNRIINENTTGSVRQNLTVDTLKKLQIPLPSLAEQEAIVKAYQTKIQHAQNLEQQAQNLEQEIEKYLDDILGIKINNKKKITKGLQKVDYKLIDKWTLDDIFNKNIIQSEKYRLVKISELCSLITDGTHQTPKYFNEGVVFLSAKNVTQQTIDWDNIKYVSKEAHNEYCKRVKPEVNDILLAKNGTTGVAALVDREMEFSIYVSLALLKPIKDKVLPEFLLNLINSNFVKTQFNSRLIGIGVPNLHLGEIRNTLVPLPTMNIQIEITKQISIYKSNINNIKSKVETLKHQAEQEFEQAIFN
ncbi:restriction endonuclease subunit S [Ornithobacterium rhinotracheale]